MLAIFPLGSAGALPSAEQPAYINGGGFCRYTDTKPDGVWMLNSAGRRAADEDHRLQCRSLSVAWPVAFADGHVEGIVAPEKKDLTISKLKDLTCLLCNGVDVPADPGKWSAAKNDHVK